MELDAGVLIILFSLAVIVGLAMATRRRRPVRRPGAKRPRMAVRLRRRRQRIAGRVRTGWYSATTWSAGADGDGGGSSGFGSGGEGWGGDGGGGGGGD